MTRPYKKRLGRCVWCRGPLELAAGVYLALLYPGRTFCVPCGRLQVECTCPR